MACMCLRVALAMITARVGAIRLRAVWAREARGTVASSVVAFAVGFIASTNTRLHRAVRAAEPVRAVALSALMVANTVVVAVVGAKVNLGLALNANKTGGAQAIAVVALSSIGVAVSLTRLFRASGTLPPNLTQARRIIPTIAVLAVWAHGLRAVSATIAHVAFTTTSDTVAAAVTRAAVRTHLLFARFAHEA